MSRISPTRAVNGMKVCARCGKNKPVSEYHRHKASYDGLQRLCKPCNTEMRADYPYKSRVRKPRKIREKKPPKPWVSTEKTREYARNSNRMYTELYRMVSGLPRSNVPGVSAQKLGKMIYKEMKNGTADPI